MRQHHLSIRTADIFGSMAFYERLGFEMETRFTAGIALACWLTGPLGRLELIQIPDPHPAPDAFADPHYVGYYHLSIEVEALDQTLETLKGAKVLLPPQIQEIGEDRYRVAFIADPDGLPIEIMEKQG